MSDTTGTSTGRNLLLGATLILCAAFYGWTAGTSQYPLLPKPAINGYYDLMAQAFVKGRLSLLVRPRVELFSLVDPYDPAQNQAYRLHDAALFRGKYYLYWGPSPAVLVFAPFRLLTGNDFPEALACTLFCTLGLVSSFLLLRLLTRLYVPRTPFWALLAAVPALAFGNIAPFVLRRPQHYETAITAGYGLVFASLYFFASGGLQEPVRRWRLALGSLLLGLAAGARFPIVAALLVPLGLGIRLMLAGPRGRARDRVLAGLALFGPAGACLLLLGVYNYARFGSWTDFGIGYMLQGIDSRQFKLFDAGRIIPGFFYYVLAPPRFIRAFPFIVLEPQHYMAPPPGYYLERVAGILPMVPLLLILAVSPWAVSRLWRSNRPILLAGGTLGATGVALLGVYCLSPGTMRYEVDFATFLLVPALLLWYEAFDALSRAPWLRRLAVAAFVLLLAVTVTFNAAVSLTGYYDNLEAASPRTYQSIRAFFQPLERLLR